jgi:hypothetical protein
MAATITPPGKGRIVPCPDCDGVPGRDCLECHGEGRYIRRACPLCGDPGWDYVNGTDDRDGMTCRISCGYSWWTAPSFLEAVISGKVGTHAITEATSR